MEVAAANKKYLTKVINFNGQKMTLYSLDGQTWSSRKIELSDILERREQQRLALAGKTEEAEVSSDGFVAGSKVTAELEVDDEIEVAVVTEEPDADIELEALAQELDQAPLVSKTKSEPLIVTKNIKSAKVLPKKPLALKVKGKILEKKLKPKAKIDTTKSKKTKQTKKAAHKSIKLVADKKKAVKKTSKAQKNSRKAA